MDGTFQVTPASPVDLNLGFDLTTPELNDFSLALEARAQTDGQLFIFRISW